MKLRELIQEDIIGSKYGVFYHRTKSDFSDVVKTRFETGYGGGGIGMGEGWYFSTSLDKSKRLNKEYLGKNIVKARVDLRKVLFLDSQEAIEMAKKIHSGSKLKDQLKSIGVPESITNDMDKDFLEKEIIHQFDIPNKFVRPLDKYIEGYLYGKNGYYLFMKRKINILNRIIPFSISKDEGKTWEKIPGDKYRKRAFKLTRKSL